MPAIHCRISRLPALPWLALLALSLPIPADAADDLFGEPGHKVIYQLNKADPEYMESILFSAGELMRKYGDDIHIVITAIGPGLHLLGKLPERPVPELLQERAGSLAMYGVEFHACGNTMTALSWSEDDLLDFATVVPIGADDLMLYQEKGYTYISW